MSTAPIRESLARVRERIEKAARRAGRDPESVRLLAVTKTVPTGRIAEAVEAGLREFGESYVQEGKEKVSRVEGVTTWHFVGRLQRNKVKDAAKLFSVIHSIDSFRLAEAVSRRAQAERSTIDVFLEVNLAGEESKGGFLPDALGEALAPIRQLPALRVRGLMAIPPLEENAEASRPHFRRLHALAEQEGLGELSMGMTHDFEIAIEEGATIVRIGTALFGQRDQKR